MNHSRRYLVVVVLIVAIGRFLPGFHTAIALIFPPELSHLGAVGTSPVAGFMVLTTFVFVLIGIPETNRKTFEGPKGILIRE